MDDETHRSACSAARDLLREEASSRAPFYAALAEKWRELFRDEDFAGFYSEVGRPSVPPSSLAVATLLSYHERLSDAEVAERPRFDLRWKTVFDLPLDSLQGLFAKSTFQAFRARLVAHEEEALAFQKSIEEAARVGLLPRRLRLALDSSPVNGAAVVVLLCFAVLTVLCSPDLAALPTPGEAVGLAEKMAPADIPGPSTACASRRLLEPGPRGRRASGEEPGCIHTRGLARISSVAVLHLASAGASCPPRAPQDAFAVA